MKVSTHLFQGKQMKHLIATLLMAFTASTFAAEPAKPPQQPAGAKERKQVTPDFSKKKEKAPAKKPPAKPVPAPKKKPVTEPAK
jgi:hypothetical protein